MKVDEWFQQFQCIDLPKVESKWNKKKINKKQLELFVSQVESNLLLLEKLLKQYGGSGNISKTWPALFHSRMLITSDTLNFKSQRYLNNILSLYLKYANKKEKYHGNSYIQNDQHQQNQLNNLITLNIHHHHHNSSTHNEEKLLLINIAESMLEYLTTHILDPDNSLIGYYAHPNLVDLFVQQQKYRKIRAIPSTQDLINKNNNNNGIMMMSNNENFTSLITTLPVIQSINNNKFNTTSTSSHGSIKSLKNHHHYIGAEISGFNSSPISSASSTSSSSSSTTSSSTSSNNANNNNNNTGFNSWRKKKELSVEYLLDLIENWSKLKNREISEEVKEFLRSKDKLGIFKGDLVIIRSSSKENINSPKYMFARFTGQVCDSFSTGSTSKRYSSSLNMEYLSVYVNPQESEWLWIARDDVYKFSKDMMDNLSSSRRIATLIECPSYKLQKIIQIKEIEYLRDYLEKNHISPVLLDKLENQSVTLRDLRDLRSMGLILSQLSTDLPLELVNNIQKMVSAEVGRFLSQMDPLSIYPPSKKDFLEILDKYPMTRPSHLKTHASYLKVSCETTISKLISQKLEILDGSRKIKVVNWWLNLIKDQVDEYLIERGYDPKAVPCDYTQSPPQNIQKVAHNLLVLHNVLPSAGTFDPTILDLIKKLKDEIYPVVQDFNQNIKFILYEWLDIPLDNLVIDFNTDDINSLSNRSTAEQVSVFFEALERSKSALSNENVLKIKRMIKDIEYLTEMINLESSISEFSLDDDRRYENHTDIIPISGLIFGRLFRIENELRTVLECWRDPKIKFPIISPSNHSGNISPRSRGTPLNASTPLVNRVNRVNNTPLSSAASASSPILSIPVNNTTQQQTEQQPQKHSIPEIIIDRCSTPIQDNNTMVSNCTTSMNENMTNEISDVNESISSKSYYDDDDIENNDDDDIEEEEEYKKPSFSKSPSLNLDFISDEACFSSATTKQSITNHQNISSSSIETVIFSGCISASSTNKIQQKISASLLSSSILRKDSSNGNGSERDILKKSSSTSVSTSLPNLSQLTNEYDVSNENLTFTENHLNTCDSPNLSASTPTPLAILNNKNNNSSGDIAVTNQQLQQQSKHKKKRFWSVPFFSNFIKKRQQQQQNNNTLSSNLMKVK